MGACRRHYVLGGKQNLEDTMKKIVIAAALVAVAATAAHAGSMADPIVEPMVIEEAAGSSAAGIWVPLLLLAIVAVAVLQ